MPAPQEGAHDCARVVQDRVPSVGVRLVALCPRMDLVALVLDGNTLAVQRVSWQRLATLAPRGDGDVTALAWSPAGAALAVGSDSGEAWIVRIDPASARPRTARPRAAKPPSNAKLSHPVSAVEWVAVPYIQPPEYYDRDAEEVDSNGLIALGDRSGCVSLYSFDLDVKIASVQALSLGTAVSRVVFSPDATRMFVAGHMDSTAILGCVPLTLLAEKLVEVFRAGAESVVISAIMEDLQEAEEAFKKSWLDDVVQTLEDSIAVPLEKLVFDFAEDTSVSPWQVLYDAYCGGGQTGSLEQFLGSDLTARGAKDLMRTIMSSSDDARGAVEKALPLAERLLFRTSEYRGLARCKSRFGPIGLTVSAVDTLFAAVESVLDLLGALSAELVYVVFEMHGFLDWLVCSARQASGSSPDFESATGDISRTEFFLRGMLEECDTPTSKSVVALHRRLVDSGMTALSKAVESVLGLSCATLSRSLAASLSEYRSSVLSFQLAEDVPRTMSIACSSDPEENFRAVFACCLDQKSVMFAEFTSPSTGCTRIPGTWKCARLQPSSGASCIRCVSLRDRRTMVLVEASSSGMDGKETLSLSLCAADGVSLVCMSDGQLPPGQDIPVPKSKQIEFCTAPSNSIPSIVFEPGRGLASVLVGSRRVVLLAFQKAIEDVSSG